MSMFVEPNFPAHPRCYGRKCSKCGREAAGEPVLNTGMEIDHQDGLYGIIYLCRSCVYDMGRKFGMASPSQVAAMELSNAGLVARLQEYREENDQYASLQALLNDGMTARQAREDAARAPVEPSEPLVEVGPAGEVMVPVKPLGRRRS